jgi:hypothetical protein
MGASEPSIFFSTQLKFSIQHPETVGSMRISGKIRCSLNCNPEVNAIFGGGETMVPGVGVEPLGGSDLV